MAVVLRSSFGELYLNRLAFHDETIFDGWERYPDEYSMACNVRPTDDPKIQDYQMGGFGLFTKKNEHLDAGQDEPLRGPVKEYIVATWARGYEISKEALRDDKLGKMGELGNKLGESAKETVEVETADQLWNNSFTTSLSADGQPICGTHTLLGGGTFTNSLSVDLSVGGLRSALTLMHTMVDSRGKRVRFREAVLMVPVQLQYTAMELVNSVLRPDTTNNADNAFKNFSLRIMVYHYLTSPIAWWLITDPRLIKSKFFWRQQLETDTQMDVWSKGVATVADMRFIMGNTDWRGIVGATG